MFGKKMLQSRTEENNIAKAWNSSNKTEEEENWKKKERDLLCESNFYQKHKPKT